MSVINQMLQDLETRRGGLDSEAAAAAPVRPAGVVYERRSPKFAIIIVVVVMLAGLLAWLVFGTGQKQTQEEPAAVVAIPASAPQPPVANPPDAAAAPVVSAPVKPTVARAQVVVLPAAKAEPAVSATKPPSVAVPEPTIEPDKTTQSPVAKNPLIPPERASEPVASTAANSDATAPVSTPPSKSAQRSRAKMVATEFDAEPQNFKNRTPQQRTDERYREALRKLNDGQTSQARSDLSEVLLTQPKHSGARLALVGLELDDKHAPQAERLLHDGMRLQPQESAFAMALARLEVERGDIASGLATLNRGLPYAGDEPEYRAFMAALLQRANRHAEAIEHYQVALRQREAANWLVGLGISLEGANRAREAEQIYRRAQQSNALPADLQEFVAQRLLQLKS